MNGQTVWGSEIQVTLHQTKNIRETNDMFTNLFVQNLDNGTTKEKLKEMFSKFGAIVSTHIK